ncbi:MAG: TrmB family transcriptional regulator [Promethearchaeota archaeon]
MEEIILTKSLSKATIKLDRSEKQLIDDLMDLNLSRNEARAYIALLPLESTTASKLVGKTGIPDSKIYRIMENLQKKGLIILQEGVPKKYIAIHPIEAMENLRTIFKTEYTIKMTFIDKLIKSLVPIYQDHEESPKIAYIIKGKTNIFNHVKRLIDDAASSITLMMPNKEMFYFLEKSIKQAQERISNLSLGFFHQEIPTKPFPFDFQAINCKCFFLIVDNKILLTISNWNTNYWHAIWTTETSLLEVSQGYFSSPSCCTSKDSNFIIN